MAKSSAILTFLIFIIFSLNAQDRYFIAFTDKNHSEFKVNEPKKFLSSESIARRNKQGIRIKNRDIPASNYYLLQVQDIGAKLLYPLKWFNGGVFEINDSSMLAPIVNLSFVSGIEKIFEQGHKALTFGDEDIFPVFTAKRDNNDYYHYGSSSAQIKMLNGHVLHNKGFRGNGLTIAVFDAGFNSVDIYPAFDSLRNRNKILLTKDFVNPASNIFKEHRHGMMVLSILAGNIPSELIGSAPEANYILIRSEDVNSEQIIEEYNWVAAAELADSLGAHVINSSLGYYIYDAPWQSHSIDDMDGKTTPAARGANIAAETGMLVITSAGNEATTSWKRIITPADANKTIAVGAVDINETYAPFSSTGPTADGRIKPDIVAMGMRTVLQLANGQVGSSNGTSFSAPIISGLAACLWQALPNVSANEIAQRMFQSASSYNNPNNQIGYGIPDFSFALDSLPIYIGDSILKLHPNPTNGEVNIWLPHQAKSEYQVWLLSSTGEIILKDQIPTNATVHTFIVPDSCTSGLYFIKVITETEKLMGKLVIQK